MIPAFFYYYSYNLPIFKWKLLYYTMKHYLTCLLVLIITGSSLAQTNLKGTVRDENGVGVPGATVKIDGSDVSTVTDLNGNFTIQLSDGYETLIISAQGFKVNTVYLTGQTTLEVSMISLGLESKMVNYGIGSQSKDEITSSVSSIGQDQMIDAPLINLEQANQGTTPGLFVQNSGGNLGENTQVRIRGGSSLTGSNDPLYVVDGVPLISGNQSNINPNSIESIEVLKDASATAIYGTRAANGVIIITTKDGGDGKMKVNVGYQLGISEAPKRLDLIDGEEHRRTIFELSVLGQIQGLEPGAGGPLQILVNGNPTPFSREFIENNYTNYGAISFRDPTGRIPADVPLIKNTFIDSLTFDTDWQDEVFRTAFSHQADIDVQGGTNDFNYFVSLGYTTQEGILIGNQFDRFNPSISLNTQLTDRLSANIDFNYIYVKDERLRENQDLGFPLQAIVLPPSDTYDPTNFDNLTVFSGRGFYNPITEVNYSNNFSFENSYIGSLSLTYDINDKFSLDANGGIDFSNISGEVELLPATLDGNPDGFTLLDETEIRNYVFNGWATYTNKLANDHGISVILGASYQESSATFESKQGFVPSLDELNSLDANDPRLLNNPVPGSINTLISSYGRINYSVKDLYNFQVSGRMDGSSKFAPDNRYGFFPAVSAGWNIHNESFYGGNNQLKLRASYGLVGNTPFDDFAYRRNYITVQIDDMETIEAINIGSADIKWETTSQLNVGLDFDFLRGKVSGSIDYYNKETSDLLFPKPISLTTGFPDVLDNIGTMTNEGFELFISILNVSTPDLTWTTDINLSRNRNIVTDLNGSQAVVGINAYLEDQPAGVFYTREYQGIDFQDGSALYTFTPDPNSELSEFEQIARANAFQIPDRFGEMYVTKNYDEASLEIVGDPNPDFFGGVTNTISYKNFDFSFLFQFVQGNDLYFATGEQLANSGINLQGQLTNQVNRWYAPGDEAPFPGLDIDGNPPLPSSRWVEDGSYIRLKNIMLTYNLPAEKLDNLGIRNLSVYVGATNIFTITDYNGYDPDVNYVDPLNGPIGQNINRGIDNFSTPQPRMIMTGIKFGL